MALRLNFEHMRYGLKKDRKNSFIASEGGRLEVDPTPLGAGFFGEVRPFKQNDFYLVKSGILASPSAWVTLSKEESYINRCHGVGSAKTFYFKNNVELTGEALEIAKQQYAPEVTYRLVKLKIVGDTLKRIRKKHWCDAEKLLSFYISTVQALIELHAKGVIHGDIKAENIIVQDITAALIDFGCSYDLNGEAVTTPIACLYWAPERTNYKAGTVVLGNPNQDVFSFGVMLDRDKTILSVGSSFKNLIRDCLTTAPEGRPSFPDILARLTAMRALYRAERKTYEDHINKLIEKNEDSVLEKDLQQRPVGMRKIDFQIALGQFEAERDALPEEDPYKSAYSKIVSAFREIKPSAADFPKLTEQLYRLRFYKENPDHERNNARICKLTGSFSPQIIKVVLGTVGIFLGIGLLVVALGCALHTGGLSLGFVAPAVKFMMGAAAATTATAVAATIGYGAAGAISLRKGIFHYKNSGGGCASFVSPSKEFLAVPQKMVVR